MQMQNTFFACQTFALVSVLFSNVVGTNLNGEASLTHRDCEVTSSHSVERKEQKMSTPRYREETNLSRPATDTKHQVTCGGTQTDSSVLTFYQLGTERSMNDFLEPNFHQRKLAGEIMNHPMSSMKVEAEGVNGHSWEINYTPSCTGKPTSTIKRIWGTSVRNSTYLAEATSITRDDIGAVASDLQNLVGTQVFASVLEPEWNLPLFAAELDKTFKMFRPSITKFQQTLGRAQKDYYRWKRQGGSVYAKAMTVTNMANGLQNWIASNWLRYRFGILPLIYDWEGFNTVVENKALSPRLTARAKSVFMLDELTDTVICDLDTYFSHYMDRKSNCTVTVRGGLLYEHNMKLFDRIGYNVSNVLPTAWELVPFSFVVDRLVNIGNLLAAMQPKVGVVELARWTKTTIQTVDECTRRSAPKTMTNYVMTCSGTMESKVTTTSVSRIPSLQVGVVPKWKYIDLSKGVHQRHLVDHIALFKTILFK